MTFKKKYPRFFIQLRSDGACLVKLIPTATTPRVMWQTHGAFMYHFDALAYVSRMLGQPVQYTLTLRRGLARQYGKTVQD